MIRNTEKKLSLVFGKVY